MPELTGRQVRVLCLVSQERVQSRCLGYRRRAAIKRKRTACTAYRNDLEQNPEQQQQQQAVARSRLLSARTRPKQQEPPAPRGKLFRRSETPPVPVPEREEETPSTSGRLLQRSKPISTTSNGLTRATDTLRRSQQDKEVPQNVTLDRKHRQSDKRNKRFSQEAGKLSPKDWQVFSKHRTCILTRTTYLCTALMVLCSQVTTDWLTTDMQEGLLDERIWKELVSDCGLDPCERPQVPSPCLHRCSANNKLSMHSVHLPALLL